MASTTSRWVPLESNPEVLTKYSKSILGAKVGEWVDVFALDEDSLAVIPQPVNAVILLFPISEEYDQFAKEQDAVIQEKGQTIAPDLFYMKQTVSNACGTVGLFHALANNAKEVDLQSGLLKEFLDKAATLDPLERGKLLETSDKIMLAHDQIAQEGQTEAPNREEELITHFVAFVEKDGSLYELDGRRQGPINHGPTTPNSLLKDAAAVCQSRIARDPNEYRFTVVALTTALL